MMKCVVIQVKVSDVGLMQAIGCGPDYYSHLLKSSLKSSVAWCVLTAVSVCLDWLHQSAVWESSNIIQL